MQIVEAMTLNKMIQDACEAVFKRVRKHADQLEYLDPLHQDADLAVGNVVLVLSHDECAQERLETLLGEAGRLKRAVAQTRGGNHTSRETQRPPRLVMWAHKLRHLLWAVCLLFFALSA